MNFIGFFLNVFCIMFVRNQMVVLDDQQGDGQTTFVSFGCVSCVCFWIVAHRNL